MNEPAESDGRKVRHKHDHQEYDIAGTGAAMGDSRVIKCAQCFMGSLASLL